MLESGLNCPPLLQQDRQCMYNVTLRHIHATIVAVENCVTYSETVLIAIGLQHVMNMHKIFFCGLPGCTIFFHIISYRAQLKKNMLK